MQKFLNIIISTFKNRKNLFFVCVAIFVIGIILGAVLPLSEDFLCFYKGFLVGYFERLFVNENFGISYLIKRILTCALILTLVFILSLNKFTFYFIFSILFYRAFILGLAFKLFLSNLLLSGAFIFVFLILINAIFLSLAISFYVCLTYLKFEKFDNCSLSFSLKTLLVAIFIAIIGCIIEFIFVIVIFRPLNLYF